MYSATETITRTMGVAISTIRPAFSSQPVRGAFGCHDPEGKAKGQQSRADDHAGDQQATQLVLESAERIVGHRLLRR